VTGAATLPALVTGQGQGATPPYADDGYAGIGGRIAAFTVAPLRTGHVAIRVLAIRGDATIARAELAVSTTSYAGSSYQVFVVAASPLAGGATLVLLRRIDLADFPVLALQLNP